MTVASPVVRPLYGHTHGAILDRSTRTPWQRQGGDWLDANGLLNGPTPTRTGNGAADTVNIAGLGGVLIQGINSVSQVVVDGINATDQCFYIAAGSGSSFHLPSNQNFCVLVPYGGNSMTVTSNAKGTWRVDPIACPTVGELAVDASYYRAPDLLSVDPTSYAALVAPKGSIPAGGQIFGGATRYFTDQGLAFVEAKTQPAPYFPTEGRGRVAHCDYSVGPQTSLYHAWLVKIGADLPPVYADEGVKYAGVTGDEGIYFITEGACANAIGGVSNPLNPLITALWDYYSTAPTGPQQTPANAYARFLVDRHVLIEVGATCNSFDANGNPVPDGIARIYLNGVPVLDTLRAWFKDPASRWRIASWQGAYQGGVQSYRAPGGTYTFGRIMASTQRIGVPPDIAAFLAAQGGATVPPPVVTPPPIQDPPPVIVVTDPPPPTEIDNMTPPEVVTLCATAYNAACALAGVPDLPAQLVAAAASSDAVTQANKDRDAALVQAKAAQDALAALKAAIVTEHAAIDAAEADADKAAQA